MNYKVIIVQMALYGELDCSMESSKLKKTNEPFIENFEAQTEELAHMIQNIETNL
jgi:hypothetical protein